jgi:hypothetical protein
MLVRDLSIILGVNLAPVVVAEPTHPAPVEDLTALAKRINEAHEAGRGREAGEALLVARAQCLDGEWLPWLESNIRFPRRRAYEYLLAAKEPTLLAQAQALVEQMGKDEEAELLRWLQAREEKAGSN